jgi:hypothetical protein
LISNLSFAQSGPEQAKLEIKYMYVTGSAIYVQFNDGAMPGCYSGVGGYLHKTESMFDEIYSMLLTISVSGGIGKGAVLYTVDGNSESWGDCTINGLAISPN